MMYNMPNDQNTSLAEKRSVQIAVLIFAICSAIWAAFFTHSYKAAIVYAIIVVCLREFYAKPYSALEEKKSPHFVKFRSIFRTAAFVIVILPSALGVFFRGGSSFRYGSPIMLLCSLYLIDEVLAIILFYRSEMTDDIGNP